MIIFQPSLQLLYSLNNVQVSVLDIIIDIIFCEPASGP
jgi:hypothetical protein